MGGWGWVGAGLVMCRNALCTQVASCGDGGGEDGPLVAPWGAESPVEQQPSTKFSGKQAGNPPPTYAAPTLTFKFKSPISAAR